MSSEDEMGPNIKGLSTVLTGSLKKNFSTFFQGTFCLYLVKIF